MSAQDPTAGSSTPSFWPLFDLVVRTPRLEWRLPREEEFQSLVDLVGRGVHDPAMMPFFVAWTDLPPAERSIAMSQWLWKHRANWAADSWVFTGAAFVGGEVIGIQDVQSKNFRTVRSVESGSWLGRAYQGRGLGREMREAMLHFAFVGLEAQEALSGAFDDNAASIATSRSIGYEDNGEGRAVRRDGWGRSIRFRLGRERWEQRRRDDIEISGLDSCRHMFVGPTLAG
jgi:RimJ/RimL family protein N-acetyltransferase